jgi:Electron transfer DM13
VAAGQRRTRLILAAGRFRSRGRLKANQGNQNYAIGAGTRLDRYRSVVIWCRRFTYAFGAAEPSPAR